MDKKTAKRILIEHKDALQVLLKSEGLGDVKAEVEKIRKTGNEGAKHLKKSLVDRIKEIPVVQKVSELGTAGTIAVATAGTAQVGIATDLTTVFVAEIANDVVEERFEIPQFIDNFVDFQSLDVWGQQVIAEKVAEVSELQPTSQSSALSEDTKPVSSASSQGNSSDTLSQKSSTEKSQESKETESKSKESKSSKEGETKGKADKQAEPQQKKAEELKEAQEKSSSQTNKDSNEVKLDIPIVDTPFEPTEGEISPHRQVSSIL
jgi:cobalamin biosynthesis protein CobT